MSFEKFDIAIEVRITHPCNPKDGNYSLHTRDKDGAFYSFVDICFGENEHKSCGGHHHNLNSLCHTQLYWLSINHESRT